MCATLCLSDMERAMTKTIETVAVGGDTFSVYIDGDFVGSVDAGVIDDDGQWIGDISDIESAVRGRFEEIGNDALWTHR